MVASQTASAPFQGRLFHVRTRPRPRPTSVFDLRNTVDLFSRIKNTDQAEELMTVLYASRELKRKHPDDEIAEQQLYDFVLEWKKTWRTEEKQQAVASAIRNLVLLGWMKLRFSESLTAAM